jgi:hypothetical protein
MNNHIDHLPNGDFKVRPQCIECGKPADHIRHTQFAGDHPYCDEHAKLESDFGEDDSYAYWSQLKSPSDIDDERAWDDEFKRIENEPK